MNRNWNSRPVLLEQKILQPVIVWGGEVHAQSCKELQESCKKLQKAPLLISQIPEADKSIKGKSTRVQWIPSASAISVTFKPLPRWGSTLFLNARLPYESYFKYKKPRFDMGGGGYCSFRITLDKGIHLSSDSKSPPAPVLDLWRRICLFGVLVSSPAV